MEIRAATDADLPGVRKIAEGFGLLDSWPEPPDFLDAEHRDGGLFVAVESGRVVGYAGTLRRGRLWHLGDLFIAPASQSSGTGSALLRSALPATGPRVTFASADPRAHRIYTRHGLTSEDTLLYLAGRAEGLDLVVRPAEPTEIATLDGDVAGGPRNALLAWYAALPGTRVWVTPGGYAFARAVRDSVLIGPAGGIDPEASARAALAAIQAADAKSVRIAVFESHPLARLLLDTGLRIVDRDAVMTSEAGLMAYDRYIPHPDLG